MTPLDDDPGFYLAIHDFIWRLASEHEEHEEARDDAA
jgi:hypothetical protein